MKTAFVADSTLGLSPEEAQNRGIYLALAQIMVEGRSYRDYLDLTPLQILEAMRLGKKVSTSHTNPADFQTLYEGLLRTHDRIVSVHASSRLSGFVATARMVAQQFGPRVLVLDSLSVNAGLGYVLEEARHQLAQGTAWEHLEEAVSPFRARIKSWVFPQSLEYLRRGGRISGLQFFIGSFLKLLPMLEFQDGLVKPIERVRSFHQGLERLAQCFRQTFPTGARVTLAHAENPSGLAQLQALIRSEGVVFEGTREAGAAVSVHAGPGTIALFAAPRLEESTWPVIR